VVFFLPVHVSTPLLWVDPDLGSFGRLIHGDFPTVILLGRTLAAMGVFGNKAMSQFPELPFALLLLKP
jgi:hypothetical protein